jgi:O-acetyl-ADP-ribose deacetylase (regulator of RNase III)
MKVTITIGEIADAKAEALCTSTNPKLSLAMGTGDSVVERGGRKVKQECERLLESAGRDAMPLGSVHATTAGTLPAKVIFHCVASDAAHKSSAAAISTCVENALAFAARGRCRSIAMPVFATGRQSHLPFDEAVGAMAAALSHTSAPVDEVLIVVSDKALANEALRLVRHRVAGVTIA